MTLWLNVAELKAVSISCEAYVPGNKAWLTEREDRVAAGMNACRWVQFKLENVISYSNANSITVAINISNNIDIEHTEMLQELVDE